MFGVCLKKKILNICYVLRRLVVKDKGRDFRLLSAGLFKEMRSSDHAVSFSVCFQLVHFNPIYYSCENQKLVPLSVPLVYHCPILTCCIGITVDNYA